MRCQRVRERVRIPARWVTVRRHHRLVRVHRRAHTKTKRVTKCHMRTVRRRITVWKVVKRHGHRVRVKRIKTVRVPVPPHIVTKTTKRVRHGQGTTVNGWLGLPDGTALAGQTVGVYTAPDNGEGRFRLAASRDDARPTEDGARRCGPGRHGWSRRCMAAAVRSSRQRLRRSR